MRLLFKRGECIYDNYAIMQKHMSGIENKIENRKYISKDHGRRDCSRRKNQCVAEETERRLAKESAQGEYDVQ